MESRAHALERPAQHRLGRAHGVDVGRVEGGDPGVEGGLHARRGGLLLDLAAVGDPVAVREGGDDHARASEVSVVHGTRSVPGSLRTLVAWPAEETLHVRRGLDLPLSEISWRATTSGGPGGQHANRTLSRVEVQFDVGGSPTLGPRQRARLLERLGPVVRASASESRSQARNRELALRTPGRQARCRPAGPAAAGRRPGRRRARRCAGWRPSAAARETKRHGGRRARRRLRRRRGRQALKAKPASAAPRPGVEPCQQLVVLVGPRAAQRGEGGVALGHERGVLRPGVGQAEVARVGEGGADGEDDLALLVGLALHDRARRLGAAGPSISSVRRLPRSRRPRADLISPAPLTRAQRRPRISARAGAAR